MRALAIIPHCDCIINNLKPLAFFHRPARILNFSPMTLTGFLIKGGIMKYQLRIPIIKPIDAISHPHGQRDKDQVADRSFSGPEYYRAVADASGSKKSSTR